MLKDLRRKVAGKKAQNVGKHFEYLFEKSCSIQGVTCIALPDGCETKGFNPQTKRPNIIRVKMPFDYILRHQKHLAFIDTKTVEGKTFCYSDLTLHQTSALNQLSISAVSGLVIWFRSLDSVQFYSVERMLRLLPGDSVGPEKEPGIYLGTSYNFDVKQIFP